MPVLAVEIVRFVDEHFPGFVDCLLVDALGKEHHFREKVPVVSAEPLDGHSGYPRPGAVRCLVEKGWNDAAGRSLVGVNTERPDGVQSTRGETAFIVFSSQVA
jgi:hypothetical protein